MNTAIPPVDTATRQVIADHMRQGLSGRQSARTIGIWDARVYETRKELIAEGHAEPIRDKDSPWTDEAEALIAAKFITCTNSEIVAALAEMGVSVNAQALTKKLGHLGLKRTPEQDSAMRRRVAEIKYGDKPRPAFGTGFWAKPGKTERLKQLIADGASITEAAADLGCSPNAAVGKAHRLGLTFKGLSTPPKAAKPARTIAPMPFKRPAPAVLAAPRAIAAGSAPSDAKDLISLEANDCRWPFGNGPYKFCGHVKAPSTSKGLPTPYCQVHEDRARGRGTEGERTALRAGEHVA